MPPDALPADRAEFPLRTVPRWIYEQSTGRLWRGEELVATGYSGAAEGKNRPDFETIPNVGPIPRGFWRMGPPYYSTKRGPYCIPLTPCEGTETYGRSAFLVHGDSKGRPGAASEGCIILPNEVRHRLWESGERIIEVVPHVTLTVA